MSFDTIPNQGNSDFEPKPPVIIDGGAMPQEMQALSNTRGRLDDLLESYQAIIRAGAVFYPVAYSFLKELGRGRQGRVFLGRRQAARGCIVEHAIKLFDPSIYKSCEEYWTDMGRIATQVTKLHYVQSPNLVSGFSYEETNGIGYLQLDVISGIDLGQLVSAETIEKVRARCSAREWIRFSRTIFRIDGNNIAVQPGVAVYILRGVLRGLERLHFAGFLHSDIKPPNIMIDRLGTVKIVDLGRAIVIGEKPTFLLGSPLYMAPEIHRREPGTVASDLYSMGLVALEMMSGKPIDYGKDTGEDDLLSVKMSLLDCMEKILPNHVNANPELVQVMKRLLDPVPEKRYASAREADVGDTGLRIIDKQLVQAGLDSEYARDLSDFLAKLEDEHSGRMEI